MTELSMPPARDFGWALKPTASSHFAIEKRPNGQLAVILNHALLRGVTAEAIHWWFQNFANLSVLLIDVPGYEQRRVPAYFLWHPVDHHSATLTGKINADGSARAGASIHIREAMQYDTYGWKYPVDSALKLFYVGADGWAMGKSLPIIGPVMMLRIHFKDVADGERHLGVHYHYEVVIGASGDNFITRQLNKRMSAKFGTEFFEAWHQHNVIEVGTFENFLPALYDQRSDVSALRYSPKMVSPPSSEKQTGFDLKLFEHRLEGYKAAANPFVYQQYEAPTFIC
ncbi:MAG: hypothetical protein AAF967_10930 [Pseudomonadota bacterium]